MELSSDIGSLKGVGPKKRKALQELGINSIYDLLSYYPRTYMDHTQLNRLADITGGQQVNVCGRIIGSTDRALYNTPKSLFTVTIDDGTAVLKVAWFNQKYLRQKLRIGTKLFVSGQTAVAHEQGHCEIINPAFFALINSAQQLTDCLIIEPVYPVHGSLNSKFFRALLKQVLEAALYLPEIIPKGIRQDKGLMARAEAVRMIHFPDSFPNMNFARKSLIFEELYLIQCGLSILKKENQVENAGISCRHNGKMLASILQGLPFSLTVWQQEAWHEICHDLESAKPMSRLLQGDVGSGKTIIAFLALIKAVENGYQGCLMVPTEILAKQHYQALLSLLKKSGLKVVLLLGSLTKKEHEAIYEYIRTGAADIVIGTHALLQDKVEFAHLGLAVTDEQHRFGLCQRAVLQAKGGKTLNVLVMTATPIPRTLILTIYGDLEVSSLHGLPPGRQPVRTFVRPPGRRKLIYEFVRKEIKAGRQAYVVCPLISDKVESFVPGVRTVSDVYQELKKDIFADIPCAFLHGQMSEKEKDDIIQGFYSNKIKLLVSTTVIEVGVNVPNATVMVIENANRFGLAQLHQLRGRIGRGSDQAYCILISGADSVLPCERLQILAQESDGFVLAEKDLQLRGSGQFFGRMQHGLPDLKIADAERDIEVLLSAREAAAVALQDEQLVAVIKQELFLRYGDKFKVVSYS